MLLRHAAYPLVRLDAHLYPALTTEAQRHGEHHEQRDIGSKFAGYPRPVFTQFHVLSDLPSSVPLCLCGEKT
jgi:hypothetical protein